MVERVVFFVISLGLVVTCGLCVSSQMIFLPPYHPQYQQQQFTIQTQQQPVTYQTHQPELDYQTALLQQQLQQQQLQLQQQQAQTQSIGQQFQTIWPVNWKQLQAAYYQSLTQANQFASRSDMSTSQVLPPVLPASPRWPIGTNTTTNTTTTTTTIITHSPRPPVNITIVMLPTSRNAEAVQPAGSNALPTPMPVTSNVTTIGTNPTPFFQSQPSNYSMKDEIPETTTNQTATKNTTSSVVHSVRSFFSSLLPGGPIGPIGGPIGPGPLGPKGPGPFGPFGPKKP